MKPVDRHPELAQMVRVLRIVVGTVALGLFAFLAVVVYRHFGLGDDQPPEGAGLLTSVALAGAGISIVVSGLVRATLVRTACAAYRKKDVPAFQQKYASAVIVGTAGSEGAGLLLCVAFMLDKDVMALTAAGICLLLVLFAMPTRDRVNHMLEMLP